MLRKVSRWWSWDSKSGLLTLSPELSAFLHDVTYMMLYLLSKCHARLKCPWGLRRYICTCTWVWTDKAKSDLLWLSLCFILPIPFSLKTNTFSVKSLCNRSFLFEHMPDFSF